MATLELSALAWILTYLVHSTLLLGLAWLASRALGERRASRELLWRVAAIGALFTAGVQVGFGVEPLGGRLALTSETQEPSGTQQIALSDDAPLPEQVALRPAITAVEAPSPAAPITGDPFERVGRVNARVPDHDDTWWIERALVLRVGAGQLVGDSTLEPLSATGERFELESTPPTIQTNTHTARWRDIDPLRAALFVLAALTLLGLTPLVRGWLHLRRALANGCELRDGALVDEWRRLLARAGLARAPRLFLCPSLDAPLTTGLLRPRVCLPARAVNELGLAAQRALLAHELAHVERRDPRWALLHAFVERLLWIQPLNRVARRELEDLAELACDERALELGARPLDLARCLTDVAGWLVAKPQRILAAPGMAARPSVLSARVRRLAIARPATVREPRRGARALFGVAALAAVCAAAPGAGISLVASDVVETPTARRLPIEATLPPPTPEEHAPLPDLDALLELLEYELMSLENDVASLREMAGPRWEEDIVLLEAQVTSLRDSRTRLLALLPIVRTTSSTSPSIDFVLRPLQPREGEENF